MSDEDGRVTTGREVEPGTRLDTDQEDGDVPHHFLSARDIQTLFADFEILSSQVVRKPAVTAKGEAAHWEVICRKPLQAAQHRSVAMPRAKSLTPVELNGVAAEAK